MTILLICALVVIVLFFVIKNRNHKTKPLSKKNKAYTIDDQYNENRKNRENEIDQLLSKIGKNGLDDLSEKERKRLDELSKK